MGEERRGSRPGKAGEVKPRGSRVATAGMGRGPRMAGLVFDHLRDNIVRGVLLPGTPVAELDLCSLLGVSRTPVREALIKLAEEGLVRIYPRRGTFVAPVAVEALRKAQFIREHLECALVAEAVRRIDATGLRQLRENVGLQLRANQQDERKAFYEYDDAFHAAIARISGHSDVWQVIMREKMHFDRIRHLSLQKASHIPLLISQHTEVVEGLANFDEVRAVAAMRRHLREVFRTIESMPAALDNPQKPLRRRKSSRATKAAKDSSPPQADRALLRKLKKP